MMSNRVGVEGAPPPNSAVYSTTQPYGVQPPSYPAIFQPQPYQQPQMVVAPSSLPPNAPQIPYQVQCPYCSITSFTVTDTTPSYTAKIMCCAFSALPPLWLGCACLPLFICKDTIHYCARCQKEVARYTYEDDPAHMSRRRKLEHGIAA